MKFFPKEQFISPDYLPKEAQFEGQTLYLPGAEHLVDQNIIPILATRLWKR